jgi:molybdopterin-guanine dinucleotide biosynthesis protein B
MEKPFIYCWRIYSMKKVVVKIDGKELELNAFAESVVTSTIKGLLSPLRGYEEGEISILVKK